MRFGTLVKIKFTDDVFMVVGQDFNGMWLVIITGDARGVSQVSSSAITDIFDEPLGRWIAGSMSS